MCKEFVKDACASSTTMVAATAAVAPKELANTNSEWFSKARLRVGPLRQCFKYNKSLLALSYVRLEAFVYLVGA
jgi:hypothetical protein